MLLGDRFALDAGLNLARNEIVEEFTNGLLGDVGTGEGELLVLLCVLNGKCGPLANLEVQVCGVLTECLCVNGSKVDLALVLLCDGFERFGERFTLLGSLGEDVCKRNTSLSDRLATSSCFQDHLKILTAM